MADRLILATSFLIALERRVGANRRWIIATALVHRKPVVTRDLAFFRRVPVLQLVHHAG